MSPCLPPLISTATLSPGGGSTSGPVSPPASWAPGSTEELELNYQPDNPWWQRVKEVTQAIVAHWEGHVAVGHTDLGGNLDILASFTGTEALLIDLIDKPNEVERLVRRITELWIRYYDELDAMIRPVCGGTSCWTPLWSPGKTYMLQSDFSYMISPRMFDTPGSPPLHPQPARDPVDPR